MLSPYRYHLCSQWQHNQMYRVGGGGGEMKGKGREREGREGKGGEGRGGKGT